MVEKKPRRNSYPKFTPEIRKALLEAIGIGTPITFACQDQGLSKQAYYFWLKRGQREKKGEYVDFFHAVKKAMARAVIGSVAKIRQIGNGGVAVRTTKTVVVEDLKRKTKTTTTTTTEKTDLGQWTAHAWLLERTHPDDFGSDKKLMAKLKKIVADKIEKREESRNHAGENSGSHLGANGKPPETGDTTTLPVAPDTAVVPLGERPT